MREYRILARLQLSSLFGINKLRHTHTPEERKGARKGLISLLVLAGSFLYLSVLYSSLLAAALRQTGELAVLPGLFMLAASMLIFLFSVFQAKGLLFGFGDYDTVMSWPVSVTAVTASRVTTMCVYNLVYAVLLLLPAGVIYGINAAEAWWFYPLYFALMLFVPALPTVLGAAVGTGIAILTAGMKKRNLFGALFQIVFALAIMLFSMRFNGELTELAGKASQLGRTAGLYPPAQWFSLALAGSFAHALLLIVSGAAAILLFAWLLGKRFVSLNARLTAVAHSGAYRMGRQERQGRLRALYRMEWRRYINSSLYLANTAFGWILLLIAAFIVGVFRPEGIIQALETPAFFSLRAALPLLFSWLAIMSATTTSAISIEGRRLWIVKSLPVPARDWLLAKLLVSLTLAVPALIIGTALLGLGLRASAGELLWLFITPLCFALFADVAGLWLNLKLPKFDWKTEAEVVKQSAAVMIQVFAGMVAVGLPAVLLIVTNAAWILPASAGCALLLAVLIWFGLIRTADRVLYRL